MALDAELRFKEANEAHAVLSNSTKRARYDAMGAGWGKTQRRGFDVSGPFARPPAQAQPSVDEEAASEPIDPSDFFRAFFGESAPFGAASPFGGTAVLNGGGKSLEATAELSLEGAFTGATRIAQVNGRRVRLDIPRGVDTGSRICVRKALGERDLVVTCIVAPHSVFTRRGADLERELSISLIQALRGDRVAVRKPQGQVLMTIPPGTRDGAEFVLPGHGMPRLGNAGAGDLRVRVKVARPTELTEEERDAAEEFLGRADLV